VQDIRHESEYCKMITDDSLDEIYN